jgi:hypothetical protein
MDNHFSAPIPGQSLTRAPGSRPYEQPPTYADPEDATYAVMSKLSRKDAAAGIAISLDKGVAATHLATYILKGGIATGLWSPDTAALIAKRVLGGIVAIGTQAGAKNIRYADEREDPLMKLMASSGFTTDAKTPEQQANDTTSDMTAPLEETPPEMASPEDGSDVTGKGVMTPMAPPEQPQPGKDEVIGD